MYASIVSYCVGPFNIFLVYHYFSVYRQYFFLKFEHFLILCKSLKLGGTNYHFKWVKVPGTIPYWKACCVIVYHIVITSTYIMWNQFPSTTEVMSLIITMWWGVLMIQLYVIKLAEILLTLLTLIFSAYCCDFLPFLGKDCQILVLYSLR